jgi:hypothetical protein
MKTVQLVIRHEEKPAWYEYEKTVQLDMQYEDIYSDTYVGRQAAWYIDMMTVQLDV